MQKLIHKTITNFSRLQQLQQFDPTPKQGHLQRMMRIFGYLKNYPQYGITIDTDDHPLPSMEEIAVNWEEQYPCHGEELPPGMPIPKGKPILLTTYVDADHAHDQLTRRSVTGFIMFANNTPIKWYSKRQNTVESSTYGAELVALRSAVEAIIEFRYKVCMMGIPIQGPLLIEVHIESFILADTYIVSFGPC